jgi:hypothetical protein
VGSGNVFILSRSPLKNNTGGKKVILDELEELAFINGRGLEYFWVRCSHGKEDVGLSMEWITRAKEEEYDSG